MKKNSIISKITRWIDNTPNELPFNKRFGAYVIDWALGGIFLGLPAVFTYGAITGKSDMFSDLYVFPSLGYGTFWSYFAGILSILFALFYYVYIPWKIYPGQTIGKKWLKLKIVNLDGSNVSLKGLLMRYVVGMFIFESGSIVVCGYIRQMITLMTGVYVETIWQWIGTILFILSSMLAAGTKSHRAFHDYIGKTKVVVE